ncbi:unnamed protein product [Staurois parvus]|uniref:Uncharacterized protein n=1 Tax=Staurois parvus TaxID=386267 RepID=A0ABN9EPL3_9NEOB|nr:unnamed protein product [Staurois parvus]
MTVLQGKYIFCKYKTNPVALDRNWVSLGYDHYRWLIFECRKNRLKGRFLDATDKALGIKCM